MNTWIIWVLDEVKVLFKKMIWPFYYITILDLGTKYWGTNAILKVNKYLLKELFLFLLYHSILREHIKNNLLEKQSFLQRKIDQYRTELATLKTTCTAKDISIQKLQSQVSVYFVWFGWFFGVLCHFQQYFSYIVAVSFIGGESGVLGENHQPAASY